MNRSIPLQLCEALANLITSLSLSPTPCEVSFAPSYDVLQGDSGLKIYTTPSNVSFGQRTRSEKTVDIATNIVAICKAENTKDVDDALNALCFIGSFLVGRRIDYGENSVNVISVALFGSSSLNGPNWAGEENDIQIDGIYNRSALADANIFSTALVVNCQGNIG